MPPTPPSDKTLAKYGLTRPLFEMILSGQGGVCAICKNAPNGRWNIDHAHVRGWAHMSDKRRRAHVRGILCWTCNKLYAGRGMTLERAEALVRYLRAHERKSLMF